MNVRIPRIEHQLLRNVMNMPRRTALTDGRRSVDHVALLAEAEAVAGALQRRGVVPGDRVAVIVGNRIELVAAAFGCWLGGFVFQPLNFRLSEPEVLTVLDDAQPSALLVDGAAFPQHAATARRRSGLRALAVLGEEGGAYDWDDGAGAGTFAAPADPSPTAALLYTGGTTGRPKGTVLSHAAWVSSSRDGAYVMRLTRRDTSYFAIPLFHVSFVHFLSAFYVGVPTILSERVRAAEVVDAIAHRGATHTVLVQAALVDVLEHLDAAGLDLPQLTTLQYGASPIAPAVIERVFQRFGSVLLQNYGSTEAGGTATFLPHEDHDPRLAGDRWAARVGSAGIAMPGAEVVVVDLAGEPVAPGELGEVRIRSAAVMDGYWGNERATREVLSDDGWLSTGDVGRIDEDGYLTIVDRMKDMIISGGENIYARDVEDTILAHPDVREAAVVGGPHPRLGEEVVAFVVPREGVALGEDDLRAWIAGRLAGYKKPGRILFETSLPRTAVDKIHKPTLRDRLRPG